MNYKDVAVLNGSLDSLSDNLLKQKMMQQQAAEKQQQFGIEQKRADTEGEFRAAMLQHYNNMEGKQADAATAAATAAQEKAEENTRRTWGDTVKMFGGWVKDGIVDPQKAQDAMGKAYSAMPDPQKAAIAKHPAVQALQNGEAIWKAPAEKKPYDMQTGPIANDKAAADLEAQRDQLLSEADQLQAQRNSSAGAAGTVGSDIEQRIGTKKAQASVLDSRAKFIRGQERAPVRVGEEDVPNPDMPGKSMGKRYIYGQPGAAAPAAAVTPAAQAATPAAKAARANALARQNPAWTKQQILNQVNQEMP